MLSNSGQEEGLRRKGDMAESEKQLWPERGWGTAAGHLGRALGPGEWPTRGPQREIT